eukprot:scaffold132502_cov36-Cyclotella_meneghiniana.AAC.1
MPNQFQGWPYKQQQKAGSTPVRSCLPQTSARNKSTGVPSNTTTSSQYTFKSNCRQHLQHHAPATNHDCFNPLLPAEANNKKQMQYKPSNN